MNRACAIAFLSWMLALSCSQQDINCCDCLEASGASDPHDYPMLPGSSEWAALKTGEEMYQACQIPNHTLKNMCTVGLVDSWLTYPLLINVFAWITPQRGIEEMQQNFNGLNELLTNRDDAGTKLLSRYALMDPSGYGSDWSSEEKGKFAITLTVFELTIAQNSSLQKMSAQQRIDLLREAIRKRSAKASDTLYEPLANRSDVYIMARVMLYDHFDEFVQVTTQDNEIKHFSETCQYLYLSGNPNPGEDLEKIIEIAVSYAMQ